MGQLEGKVAVILGASSGIGKLAAKVFAAEGANVVIAARRLTELEAVAGDIGAVAVKCDITSDSEVEAFIGTATDKFGNLDIAMNCAGFEQALPLSGLTPEKLEPMIAVQFTGAVSFMRHAAAAMKQGGSIINVTSLNATLAGEGLAAYSGSKAAVNHISKIAALEYGPRGVRVNALAPSFIKTEMTEKLFKYGDLIQAFIEETPLRRMGTVEDVVNAALFLAGDSSSFITGQVIHVDGGGTLTRLPTHQQVKDIALRRSKE